MTRATEEQIVERCRSGSDHAAFQLLYQRYAGEVLRFAGHLLSNRTDAEEATQETFIRLYWSLQKGYDAKRPLRPYLLQIARNVALRCLERSKKRTQEPIREEHPGDLASPSQAALDRERKQLVTEALNALSPGHRTVLVLRHAHGLKLREVASVLECTERTVRNRLRTASLLFKRELSRREVS